MADVDQLANVFRHSRRARGFLRRLMRDLSCGVQVNQQIWFAYALS